MECLWLSGLLTIRFASCRSLAVMSIAATHTVTDQRSILQTDRPCGFELGTERK